MKGIPFIAEMAAATQRAENPKTQTRRVIVPQPVLAPAMGGNTPMWRVQFPGTLSYCFFSHEMPADTVRDLCDYVVGERRCLLTTWSVHAKFDRVKPRDLSERDVRITGFWHAGLPFPKMKQCGKLRPGRFLPNHLRPLMPVFEVTAVRAERVQDISEADAKAEGIKRISSVGFMRAFGWADYLGGEGHFDPRASFQSLWDSINAFPRPVYASGPKREILYYESFPWAGEDQNAEFRGKPWALRPNPWVWAITFKRVSP